MEVFKPQYFDTFRCLAAACPDSCCQEWDVLVDADSAARYRSAPGPLGDALRAVLSEDEDGGILMLQSDGRCPMWRADGLCRIQAAWGEDALCKTCRDFPRLRHDYGDFVELGLELSCPEAARLILTSAPAPMLRAALPGGEDADYDRDAMAILRATRQTALRFLSDETLPAHQALAVLLIYGYAVQEQLDGGEEAALCPQTALETARGIAQGGDLGGILDFYKELEILTPGWKTRLDAPASPARSPLLRPLARYFVERYWLQAVSDYDLVGRVKFSIVSCLVIDSLGGDFLQTAQLYSKEIENDADNVDALLDAAYTAAPFADIKLLDLLLN